MANYFIDYENVNSKGLAGLNMLTNEDNIFLFYSENANTLTFGLHQQLINAKSKIEYFKVDTKSSNALDFQLSTYLGFLVAKNNKDTYFVVSKDKGFQSIVTFWSKKNVDIKLVIDLTRKDRLEAETALLKALDKISLSEEEKQSIVKIIDNYKSKQGINNALVKNYTSKRGGEIYKIVKPFIVEKK